MSPEALKSRIVALVSTAQPERGAARALVAELFAALEQGAIRAAEPFEGGWKVNDWVKQGILLAFRVGENREVGESGVFHFRDRDTLPTWSPHHGSRDVRIVPGGTTVRRGSFLDDGVVLMPPSFVNVGAYVGRGSMVDSHALVGSCAQVGCGVHLSAAVQIGGVLEPIGALPVIIEDEAFVGGGCGIYEGTRVGRAAVLAPGVVLTRSLPVFDLVHEREVRAAKGQVLEIPPGAVVVPGSRPAAGPFAERRGLHLHAAVIVKYRDRTTDAATILEEALR